MFLSLVLKQCVDKFVPLGSLFGESVTFLDQEAPVVNECHSPARRGTIHLPHDSLNVSMLLFLVPRYEY